MPYHVDGRTVPSFAEITFTVTVRKPFCPCLRQYIPEKKCDSLSRSRKVNEKWCEPSKCQSPRRICNVCMKHGTVDGHSYVIEPESGRCEFHTNKGAQFRHLSKHRRSRSRCRYRNTSYGNLSILEVARLLKKQANSGISVKRLALAWGRSDDWVYRHLRVLHLPVQIQQQLERGEIGFKTVILLSRYPIWFQARMTDELINDELLISNAVAMDYITERAKDLHARKEDGRSVRWHNLHS